MEIGRKILNLRRDQGVGQRQLADQVSATASALSRIEAGIHEPRGSFALEMSRRLGVTADYILDDNAPYPPPAYEILANLVDTTVSEPRDRPTVVSAREERVVDAFRALELERKRLLESCLGGSRERVRLAAWVLGAELPGADAREVERFRDRLRALAAGSEPEPAPPTPGRGGRREARATKRKTREGTTKGVNTATRENTAKRDETGKRRAREARPPAPRAGGKTAKLSPGPRRARG